MMQQISSKKINFIKKYIKRIQNSLQIYESNFESPNNDNVICDVLFETIKVLEDDIPNLNESIFLKPDTLINDANILIGLLKKYLIDNGYVKATKETDSTDKFCKSLKAYFEFTLPETDLLKEEFLYYDNWNGGTHNINIDYNEQFLLNYGIEFKIEELNSFASFKMFLELAYNHWIKTDKRYDFTKEINGKLRDFKLPYLLKGGKIVSQGYKTNFIDKKIINFQMLERKINYAEEMILSNEILDKKSALDYIVDSLQYLISIQNGTTVKDKYMNTAKMISGDKNNKLYTVINNEIKEIMKIVNEFFDIRHNEYLNKSNEIREAINDSLFIEYMYNRVYGLLFLIKVKYNYINSFD